jgi:hypothetical protein
MCVAELEACLDWGTKKTPMLLLRAVALVIDVLVMTNELHLDECY